jgi:hypothetical protein
MTPLAQTKTNSVLSSYMHLPHELQHFPHPTLIVASDHFTARFFFIGGDTLEELDGLTLPKNLPNDDGSRVGGLLADVDDAPRLTQFVKQIAARLEEETQKHDVQTIHLVMSADVEGALHTHISATVLPHLSRIIHRDLMNEAPLEIVKRILEKE